MRAICAAELAQNLIHTIITHKYQLLVVSCQLLVVSCQLSVVSCQLSVAISPSSPLHPRTPAPPHPRTPTPPHPRTPTPLLKLPTP
ncbi:hypothetical protein JYQ62_08665 [Nostoc sp. UHCC 0702]|nr:hypothetical protein JYQ62_08665 [Nostoc sp. UHCC 0702]